MKRFITFILCLALATPQAALGMDVAVAPVEQSQPQTLFGKIKTKLTAQQFKAALVKLKDKAKANVKYIAIGVGIVAVVVAGVVVGYVVLSKKNKVQPSSSEEMLSEQNFIISEPGSETLSESHKSSSVINSSASLSSDASSSSSAVISSEHESVENFIVPENSSSAVSSSTNSSSSAEIISNSAVSSISDASSSSSAVISSEHENIENFIVPKSSSSAVSSSTNSSSSAEIISSSAAKLSSAHASSTSVSSDATTIVSSSENKGWSTGAKIAAVVVGVPVCGVAVVGATAGILACTGSGQKYDYHPVSVNEYKTSNDAPQEQPPVNAEVITNSSDMGQAGYYDGAYFEHLSTQPGQTSDYSEQYSAIQQSQPEYYSGNDYLDDVNNLEDKEGWQQSLAMQLEQEVNGSAENRSNDGDGATDASTNQAAEDRTEPQAQQPVTTELENPVSESSCTSTESVVTAVPTPPPAVHDEDADSQASGIDTHVPHNLGGLGERQYDSTPNLRSAGRREPRQKRTETVVLLNRDTSLEKVQYFQFFNIADFKQKTEFDNPAQALSCLRAFKRILKKADSQQISTEANFPEEEDILFVYEKKDGKEFITQYKVVS